MTYQYTYIIGDLIALIAWIILFFWRKDNRRELLLFSFFFGIIGLLVEPIYVVDWWMPQTITGTIPGIEEFLFGFVVGGFCAVVYEDVFKKRVRIRKVSEKQQRKRDINLFILLAMALFLFFGGFFLFNLNSFQASILALLVPTLIVWFKRKDLIMDSIATGVIAVMFVALLYTILNLITPGWIEAFWYFRNVPNIVILNMPIDDIVWYFLAGALLGPLYEYWQEAKLVKAK